MFHVRGSIDPEVFNPVHDAMQNLALHGFQIRAIPGNHDLKSRETTELGNAMQSLNALDGFSVVTSGDVPDIGPHDTLMIPWVSTADALRETIKQTQAHYGGHIADLDLIIHTGINGVLKGLPDHGLDAEEVAGWGFKRVFAGHYHDHKVMADGKVISIGALTHQTWSDVGSKAGFLLVYPDKIKWQASHAPHFVEVTDETAEEDVPLIVDGNYVRVRGKSATDAEINEMRQAFLDLGAKGFSYQGVREVVTARGPTASHKATSLEASIAAFISERELPDADAITAQALDVLGAVRARTD
jgi:DNA repair exonuclease SbcCD nuclease subunit